MVKTHQFDVALAMKYGPVESIVLSNLCWWTVKNIHNNKNYHKGRYWVYNSFAAFEKLFPYLNSEQIKHTLKKLKNLGAIYVDNFNKQKYDRTLWYSVSDEVFNLFSGKQAALGETDGVQPQNPDLPCPNGNLHCGNLPNANDQMGDSSQMGICGENDMNSSELTVSDGVQPENPDLPCPNGNLHCGNLPNGSGKNTQWIGEISTMDQGNLPNGLGKFTPPIPDINPYKPPPKPSKAPEAEKESFISLFKNFLITLNRKFIFSEDFYENIWAYHLNNDCRATVEYCRWFYAECLKIDYKNISNLYYKSFGKNENYERFVNEKLVNNKPLANLIKCPVCDKEYNVNLERCPSCDMDTALITNPVSVEFHKHYISLSNTDKDNYDSEIKELLFKLGSLPFSAFQKNQKEIYIKYGFVKSTEEVSV